jgi:phosphohistidine phosphatase
MKTIFIVRHAKAHRKGQNSSDFDRMITSKGQIDAHHMGHFLKSKNILPDLIISSPAPRAIETAKILANEMQYPQSKIEINQILYDIEFEELLKVLTHLDDDYQSVMFVGHNPPMSTMSDYLTKYGVGILSPGSIFCCEYKTDTWQAISKYGGMCKFLEFPEDH